MQIPFWVWEVLVIKSKKAVTKYSIGKNENAVNVELNTASGVSSHLHIAKGAKVSKVTVKGDGYTEIRTQAKSKYIIYGSENSLTHIMFFKGAEKSTIEDKYKISCLTNATTKDLNYVAPDGEVGVIDKNYSTAVWFSDDGKTLVLYGFCDREMPIKTIKLDGKTLLNGINWSTTKLDKYPGDSLFEIYKNEETNVEIYFNLKTAVKKGNHKVKITCPGYPTFTLNVTRE